MLMGFTCADLVPLRRVMDTLNWSLADVLEASFKACEAKARAEIDTITKLRENLRGPRK